MDYIKTDGWSKLESWAVRDALLAKGMCEASRELWPQVSSANLYKALELGAINQFDFDRIKQRQRYWEDYYHTHELPEPARSILAEVRRK